MVSCAITGGLRRGRADDAGGGAAGGVGSGGSEQQQAGLAELPRLAAVRVAEQAGAVAVAARDVVVGFRRVAAQRVDS